MGRPRKNYDDPRNRYTHTAYDVTFGGIAPERGPSGRDTLLGGTYQAAFQFVTPANGGARIVGDLPMGVWINGIVNHVALEAGTFTLELLGVGGEPDITLVAGVNGDLTTVGLQTSVPVWTPLGFSRPLRFTPVGGLAGETAVISVLATPAETGWK